MKKSLSQAIALATLVGATAAQADVLVNHEGIGGALVYPLYTVNDGNTSLVSVVNTTDQFKAVKVRFVEGKNSAEVLDFHLYLSPKDVWSGTIVPTATGAKLVSNDRSCIAGVSANDGTFPKDGLPFRTEQIDMDEERLAAADRSSQADKVARVRVGHFEAIEMGTIDYISATKKNAAGDDRFVPDALGGNKMPLLQAIKHVDGVPGSCDVVTRWWTQDLDMDKSDRVNQLGANAKTTLGTVVTEPTGGLYGTGGIVNVAAGWAASFDAVALVDSNAAIGSEFYTTPQHPRPGSIYPHLGTVTADAPVPVAAVDTALNQASGVADNGTEGGAVAMTGVTYVVPADSRLNEVTVGLNLASIYNDYYVEPALDAGTELIVTFPTKRFYTFETLDADKKNVDYGYRYIYTSGTYDFATRAYTANDQTIATDPEGADWAKNVAKATAPLSLKSAFETRWDHLKRTARVGFESPTLYGKDEQEIKATDGFISPRPTVQGEIDLNWEANVIALNGSNALGADGLVSVNVNTPFMEGWLELDRVDTWNTAVPAVGFGVITTKNGVSADGALRNFAQTFKHKTVR